MSFRKPSHLLKKLDLLRGDQLLLSERCRDSEEVKVMKDSETKVIYLDWDEIKGHQINYKSTRENSNKFHLEDFYNTESRIREVLPFLGKHKILDFGCGEGSFLKALSLIINKENCLGLEASKNSIEKLQKLGIYATNNLESIEEKISLITCFHVLEHLDQPEIILKKFFKKLKETDGFLIIEVPHANDPLISLYKNKHFQDFTFWSQHLILHTKISLERLINYSGFSKVDILLKQRYPISNHLNWLIEGKPGGHKTKFSLIDNDILNDAYSNSLIKQGYADTLVAICKI